MVIFFHTNKSIHLIAWTCKEIAAICGVFLSHLHLGYMDDNFKLKIAYARFQNSENFILIFTKKEAEVVRTSSFQSNEVGYKNTEKIYMRQSTFNSF